MDGCLYFAPERDAIKGPRLHLRCQASEEVSVYKLLILVVCVAGVTYSFASERLKPVKDRNTLCALEFGKFANGVYVGSTPMEDACGTEHYESRKKICEHNYDRTEIVNACLLTYDAITKEKIGTLDKEPVLKNRTITPDPIRLIFDGSYLLIIAGSTGMIIFATGFPLSSKIGDLCLSSERFLELHGYGVWMLSWVLIITGTVLQMIDYFTRH